MLIGKAKYSMKERGFHSKLSTLAAKTNKTITYYLSLGRTF